MASLMFGLSTLIVVVAIVSYFYLQSKNIDIGFCQNEEKPLVNENLRKLLSPNITLDATLECYFSENYFEARNQFLQLVKLTNGELVSMRVMDGLTTDAAIYRRNPTKFLIHISGTHGVEAYAGSASQAAILDYIRTQQESSNIDNDKLPTLVFIHALNPFGFANNRRVNEDNVDLNRNILSTEEFRFVKSRDPNYAGYVDLDSNLNPTSKFHDNHLLNEIISYIVVAKALAKYGLASLKKALVSGNYHKQKGVGFGGFEQTKSIKNLIQLLVEDLGIPKNSKDFILLDVHTGLGPEGIDTLMYHGSSDYIDAIEEKFPTDYNSQNNVMGGIKVEEFSASPLPNKRGEKVSSGKSVNAQAKDVASGYELTVGTVSGSLCSNYLASKAPDLKFLCITQVSITIFCPLFIT